MLSAFVALSLFVLSTFTTTCLKVDFVDYDFSAVDFAITALDFDIHAGVFSIFIGFRGYRGFRFLSGPISRTRLRLAIEIPAQADLRPAVDGPGRRTRSQVAEVGSRRRRRRVAALVWNDDDVLEERQRLTGVIGGRRRRHGRCVLDTLDVTYLLTAATRRRACAVRERTPSTDDIQLSTFSSHRRSLLNILDSLLVNQGRGHDRQMLISQQLTSCLANHSELCKSRQLNNQSRRISTYRLRAVLFWAVSS